ncbi:hypothetical protein EsDP_00005546 [Epichloe bromicola]|uniref:Uncharacterized protein n=1 Tax=Epichloe bromicola TaxID=79588 RepID=A0ABQ0CV32_9HYPO
MGQAKFHHQPRRPGQRRPIQHFSLILLVTPLVLLSAATAFVLFLSSDPNVNSLFTRCFSDRDRDQDSPAVAQVPVGGPPTCCLVSFFHAALDSRRSFAIMNEILSFVGALLTITTIESARTCHKSTWMIRNPTASWLLFNLAGGAVVWQLAIVPAFFHYGRDKAPPSTASSGITPDSKPQKSEILLPAERERGRHLSSAELHAIPLSVALGYLCPCIPFLLYPSSTSILIWLFFPAYVSVVRQLVRCAVPSPVPAARRVRQIHPEAHTPALVGLYALPLLWSVMAHFGLLYHLLFVADDRSVTTKAALAFIQADFGAIGLTVLYWIAIEAGWQTAVRCVVVGGMLGPGAGLCVAWVARERELLECLPAEVAGRTIKDS